MGKEGGVATSGAAQYGFNKFSRDASENSAIRTIDGKRKHLDHLIVDRLRANELTYGVAGDEHSAGEEARVPEQHAAETEARASHSIEEEHRNDEPYDPSDPKWFTPAFTVRSERTTELAKKISGPRSPSGAFVSAENPSVARPTPNSTRPTAPSSPHDISTFAGARRR